MIKIKLLNKAQGEIELEESKAKVIHLKERIHEISGINVQLIKLIFYGKTIEDDNASVLGWNGKKVLVLIKTEESILGKMNEEVKQMQENRQIERISMAASIISERSLTHTHNSQMTFQLMNQKGVSITIPEKQSQYIMEGMILYQQGRSELRTINSMTSIELYEKALKYFVAAEVAFKKCDDDLLCNTDNFATLCLDIAWAMYATQRLQDTKRLSELLTSARTGLTLAHGANLERLYAVKGPNCAERVLYVRLQLLEGIMKCLLKDFNGAFGLLLFAQQNCQDLTVSEESIQRLRQRLENYPLLGPVSTRLAIRALRAGHSDIDHAIGYVVDRDLKERDIRARESEEATKDIRQKQYGLVKDGGKVSLELVDSLSAAGFLEVDIVSACIEFNNNVDLVLQAVSYPDSVSVPNYKLVKQLKQMGYMSAPNICEALKLSRNDISAAIDLLSESMSNNAGEVAVAVPGSMDSVPTSEHQETVWEAADTTAEESHIAAAYDDDDESHLDLDLRQEQEAIQLYLNIASAGLSG